MKDYNICLDLYSNPRNTIIAHSWLPESFAFIITDPPCEEEDVSHSRLDKLIEIYLEFNDEYLAQIQIRNIIKHFPEKLELEFVINKLKHYWSLDLIKSLLYSKIVDIKSLLIQTQIESNLNQSLNLVIN